MRCAGHCVTGSDDRSVRLAGGGGVAGNLSGGGFDDPNAESSRAKELLASRFDTGDPNLVLVVFSYFSGYQIRQNGAGSGPPH